MPEKSQVDISRIEIDPDTKQMLRNMDFGGLQYVFCKFISCCAAAILFLFRSPVLI